MPDLSRFVAHSVSQYVEIVENLGKPNNHTLWFRGHSKNSYRLVPGVLRETTKITDGRGQELQKGDVVHASGGIVAGPSAEQMLAEFKQRSRPFVSELPQNEFEWMFLAQHYGLPTRLIDWSTNALVGLYFAASGANTSTDEAGKKTKEISERFLDGDDSSENGFAVYVINPVQMNQEAIGVSNLIDISRDFESWEHYINPMAHSRSANIVPLCVTAPHNSTRLHAQSGAFTLHGKNIWPLDYYDVLRPHITKIFFPNSVTKRINSSLSQLGMNRTFVYPGLDSVAFDVRTKHLEKHRTDFEGW